MGTETGRAPHGERVGDEHDRNTARGQETTGSSEKTHAGTATGDGRGHGNGAGNGDTTLHQRRRRERAPEEQVGQAGERPEAQIETAGYRPGKAEERGGGVVRVCVRVAEERGGSEDEAGTAGRSGGRPRRGDGGGREEEARQESRGPGQQHREPAGAASSAWGEGKVRAHAMGREERVRTARMAGGGGRDVRGAAPVGEESRSREGKEEPTKLDRSRGGPGRS